MFCPFCGSEETRVRDTVKGSYTYRFRVCQYCGEAFETVEKPKIDKRVEDYIKEVDEIESKVHKTDKKGIGGR